MRKKARGSVIAGLCLTLALADTAGAQNLIESAKAALAACNTRYPAGNPKTAVARATCINAATEKLLPSSPFSDILRDVMANRLSVARAFASHQITWQQANTLIAQKAMLAQTEIRVRQQTQAIGEQKREPIIVRPQAPADDPIVCLKINPYLSACE